MATRRREYHNITHPSFLRHPVWSAFGFNTPVIEGKHICSQSKSERAASSPGVVPVGPCMCCRSFLSRRRRPGHRRPFTCIFSVMSDIHGHSFLISLYDRHHAGRIASDTSSPITDLPSFADTSRNKGAELLRRNDQRVLRGKTLMRLDVLVCWYDVAVSAQLLVKRRRTDN
jgi:hypothetical protein